MWACWTTCDCQSRPSTKCQLFGPSAYLPLAPPCVFSEDFRPLDGCGGLGRFQVSEVGPVHDRASPPHLDSIPRPVRGDVAQAQLVSSLRTSEVVGVLFVGREAKVVNVHARSEERRV